MFPTPASLFTLFRSANHQANQPAIRHQRLCSYTVCGRLQRLFLAFYAGGYLIGRSEVQMKTRVHHKKDHISCKISFPSLRFRRLRRHLRIRDNGMEFKQVSVSQVRVFFISQTIKLLFFLTVIGRSEVQMEIGVHHKKDHISCKISFTSLRFRRLKAPSQN